jgi:CRISPR-associated endonuclease/helicase Cas3
MSKQSDFSSSIEGGPAAHVRRLASGAFEIHALEAHLQDVAKLAAEFAAPMQSGSWAELAGLWHDLGKYQDDFQRYLSKASGQDAHIEAPGRVKHAIAGAIHAVDSRKGRGRLLAYLIAGHHAGLPDWYSGDGGASALEPQLADADNRCTLAGALRGGVPQLILNPAIDLSDTPPAASASLHFWLRMLFSCLVDADFLDTEAFMDQGRTDLRTQPYATIPVLREAYECFMAERFAVIDTPVKRLRAEIREHCIAQASEAPGLFSLSVPTGGGKTLASLGFALHHAERHGLRRVIYVIPYTSIIEQTAGVFREVFAGLDPEPVIEHHSNFEPEKETAKSRISCENWDAPVVVTTSVQFFESLFAARPSRCRKLHNLIGSVIVLDEAQLLPPEHLHAILDALRQLMTHYGVTVVLSTATQPELQKTRSDSFGRVRLPGLGEARELAPDPGRLYRELERVQICLPSSFDERMTWPVLATELGAHERVLCIVNRRDDAADLLRLMPVGTLHLSARMCGAHRAELIAQIQQKLRDGESIRVVSTQLVEAGVDFDFPVVYRAMAGLDSIAQAAGRCNREGRLSEKGRVVVFNPPKPSPSGLLYKAEQAAQRVLLADGVNNSASLMQLQSAHFTRFFDLFFASVNSYDKEGVLDLLHKDAAAGKIQFRTAAEKFRLIEDRGQRSVFVLYGDGQSLIEDLRMQGPHRELMRRLQRHSVTLYEHQWKKLLACGDLVLQGDFIVQRSEVLYDSVLGLLPEAPDYDPADLVR